MKKLIKIFLSATFIALAATVTNAADLPASQADLSALKGTLQVGIDTVWVLLAAFLVFFMNLGFAMVESGLCRAKILSISLQKTL